MVGKRSIFIDSSELSWPGEILVLAFCVMKFIAMVVLGLCLFALCADGQTTYWISTNTAIASDANTGLTSSAPWLTFKNINFLTHGSHTFTGPNIFRIQGFINAGGAGTSVISFPVLTGSSNNVQRFTSWDSISTTNDGKSLWGITNAPSSAIAMTSYNWMAFDHYYLANNGYATQDQGLTNCEWGYGIITNSCKNGVGFLVYGNSNSNYYHDIAFQYAGFFDNGGCRDGGSGLLGLGLYGSPTDLANYNIIERCTFTGNGHHGLSLSGSFNYVINNAFTNPVYYQATWCGAGYVNDDTTTYLTGSVWGGGREVDLGGSYTTCNVVRSNDFSYSGFVPDMPGALQIEGGATNDVSYNYFVGDACQGISIYGNGAGGPLGNNFLVNNTLMGCGSNLTWYVSGNTPVYVSYPEYNHPVYMHNTTGNVCVNNLSYDNQFNGWYFDGGFSPDVADFRGNITNVNPLWVNTQNSVADLTAVTGDPLLMPALNLLPGSPALQTGQWTGSIGSPTGSGTSFIVTNAGHFSAGLTACTRYIPGDVIQFQGTFQMATVLAVNIGTSVITVDHSVSWTRGQGVDLAYNGSAPNVGAFDQLAGLTINGAGAGNLPNINANGAGVNINGVGIQ